MFYCEKCKMLSDDNCCPECETAPLRTVKEEDFCLLTECPEDQGKMLAEAFKEEQIPCALIPQGSGVRSALGLNLENVRVYLPYRDLERGKELFCGIIIPPLDETEELRALLLENEDKWHVTGFFNKRSIPKKLGLPKNENLSPILRRLIESASNVRDAGLNSSSTEASHYLIVKTEQYDLTFDSISFELFHVKKKS